MYKLTVLVLLYLIVFPVFSRVTAFVSIVPQKYILKAVGGDKVEIRVLIGIGQTPHSYKPTPRQLINLSKADVFFRVGAPFEEQVLKKVSSISGQLVIADMAKGIKKRQLEEHGHDHGGEDPHVWLSPKLLEKQAQNIVKVLSELDVNNRNYYNLRLKKFKRIVNDVYLKLKKRLKPYYGAAIFVYHPAFGYFLDSFGLKQVPVEVEGKSPTPKALKNLVKKMREHNSKVIFVQPQFARDSAQLIAQTVNGEVIRLDPLSEDILENFNTMADKIVMALQKREE